MADIESKYCPLSNRSCQDNCSLYDTQFQACLIAVFLSGMSAWSSMKVVANMMLDDTDPKARLFKAIDEQARISVVDGMKEARKHKDHGAKEG